MKQPSGSETRTNARSLWLMVLVAFLVLIAAWTALIVIATRNQPEMIEVETP